MVRPKQAGIDALHESGQSNGPEDPSTPPTTATRGRGLAIISALAQKVEFRAAGHGTELRLDFSRAA